MIHRSLVFTIVKLKRNNQQSALNIDPILTKFRGEGTSCSRTSMFPVEDDPKEIENFLLFYHGIID